MAKIYDSHKKTFDHIIERQRQIAKNFLKLLARYLCAVQEDVHSRTSIDGGKSIAMFLNAGVQKMSECANEVWGKF